LTERSKESYWSLGHWSLGKKGKKKGKRSQWSLGKKGKRKSLIFEKKFLLG
jgi:hypothetical protein